MNDSEIWDRVEALRSGHPSLQAGHLPLDHITFVDLELGLDLIPYDGLARFGADAAVLADFSGIYVDRETFDMIDTDGYCMPSVLGFLGIKKLATQS